MDQDLRVQSILTHGINRVTSARVRLRVVTVGALLAGIVDQPLPVDPSFALLVESVFTTAGFTTIVYSMYVE